MLIKLLNFCDKNPEQYTSLIYLGKADVHRLIINENI